MIQSVVFMLFLKHRGHLSFLRTLNGVFNVNKFISELFQNVFRMLLVYLDASSSALRNTRFTDRQMPTLIALKTNNLLPITNYQLPIYINYLQLKMTISSILTQAPFAKFVKLPLLFFSF